ncbi:hypothetical protein EW146_g6136 [Bondarzewia mesenterica]|uniref:Uncharacterized protein n=1 Tax=Bondarzewia mesenterica TaxID=1095465 RepID=A0A4S4LQ30_9AGAM|nr:hypothetical protein EW146_g6136 [Bondarzewia mesenterica]
MLPSPSPSSMSIIVAAYKFRRSTSLHTLSSIPREDSSGLANDTPPSSSAVTSSEPSQSDIEELVEVDRAVSECDCPLHVQNTPGKTSMHKPRSLSKAASKAKNAARKFTQLLRKVRRPDTVRKQGGAAAQDDGISSETDRQKFIPATPRPDNAHQVFELSASPTLEPQCASYVYREVEFRPFSGSIVRALLFPLWTALVGAALLMYPKVLPRLVFRSGFTPAPISPLDRIAYYGNCAIPHVGIFVASVLSMSLFLNVGVCIALYAVIVARTASVWWRYGKRRAERMLDEATAPQEIMEWEMDMWCAYLVFAGKEELFVFPSRLKHPFKSA